MPKKKRELEQERSYVVAKSNTLIQDTKYKLPLLEYKILLRILQKIKPDMKKIEPVSFEIREFCRLCGIDPDSGKNYENIRKAVLNLKGRTVWIQKLDNNMNPVLDKRNKPVLETFSWVSKAEMSTGEGIITVVLDEALEKYIMNLDIFVTYLNAYAIYPMKSKYSARLYELLRSYLNMKKVKFTIQDLHDKVTDNYPVWSNFHQKVIKPAVQEINQLTEMNVSYVLNKQGRSVIGVDFSMSKKGELESEVTKRYTQQLLTGYDGA